MDSIPGRILAKTGIRTGFGFITATQTVPDFHVPVPESFPTCQNSSRVIFLLFRHVDLVFRSGYHLPVIAGLFIIYGKAVPMLASNYANMTTAYEAQKWWIPIYLNIIFAEAIVGLFFFAFAFCIIVFKTPKLNSFFRWGLVESLVFPTIFCLFIGIVFKPYAIAPYELYWSYGYFRTPFAVWCQGLTVGTLGCFFIFSLLFLCYVYIKAFVGRGILQIGKTIKGFFLVAGICLPSFGFVCTYLEYSNLEEKQEKDRATVIAGDSNNTMFFNELGAYILNMEGTGTLTHIQYGGILFFAVASIIIGLFIFFKIIYILEKRRGDISSATKKLQKTFILIVLVQIYMFIVFYGIPASSLFILMSFKLFFLAPYPIMSYMVIHFMLIPIAYSIMNLTIISQVRHACIKFLRCGRIIRLEISVTAAARTQVADATRNTRSTRIIRNTRQVDTIAQ